MSWKKTVMQMRENIVMEKIIFRMYDQGLAGHVRPKISVE